MNYSITSLLASNFNLQPNGYTGSAGTTGYTGSASTVIGYTGSIGETGLGFSIAKSYGNVAALTADTNPTGITAGQFAIVETGNVNDSENSRLYLWTGSAYNYVTDLSGASGITGPQGSAGSTGYTGSTGYSGSAGSVGLVSGNTAPADTTLLWDDLTGTGQSGYTGSQGLGYTGSAGVGYTGSAGTSGTSGTNGYTGSSGTNGYTGSSGVTISYAVTNNGSTDYVIKGQNDPTLTIYRGFTYVFNVNAPGHPFWIKTTAVLGTASAYNTGVTNNGAASGEIQWTVAMDAPDTLYYICQFHSAMVGQFTVKDPGDVYNLSATGTGYFAIPSGNTAQRPSSPAGGMIRYNTTTDALEWYSSVSSVWISEPGGLGTQNNPAESAAAIQAIRPNATNGFYWIKQTGTTAYQHYCVFTALSGAAIAGGPWTVPFVFGINNTAFSTVAATSFSTYNTLCASVGINTPGRGMESTRTTTEVYGAWLAAKRAIWEGFTNFVSGKSSGDGGVLTMPLLNNNGEGGTSAHRLVYNNSLSTHIPPNIDGDRCDGNQLFCGWWGSTDVSGWTNNNDNIPGPEDWGPTTPATGSTNATYGYTGYTTMAVCCIYK